MSELQGQAEETLPAVAQKGRIELSPAGLSEAGIQGRYCRRQAPMTGVSIPRYQPQSSFRENDDRRKATRQLDSITDVLPWDDGYASQLGIRNVVGN